MARMTQGQKRKVVAVSGGFDPLHIGHVRMFQHARSLGDELVVILNNDNWLKAKKGYAFMPQKERKEIIESIAGVDRVVYSMHTRSTQAAGPKPEYGVSREIAKLKPAIFANGGDRKNIEDIPEGAVCKKYGIEMVFNVGKGGKVQSSSWLVDAARKHEYTQPHDGRTKKRR